MVSRTTGQAVAAGGLVLMLIGLFLPWLSGISLFAGQFSENGFNSWGWLSLFGFVAGAVIVLAVFSKDRRTAAAVGPSDIIAGRLMVVVGGAAILGVLIFCLQAPIGSPGYVEIHVGVGLVLTLVGALGLVAGGELLSSPRLARSLGLGRK